MRTTINIDDDVLETARSLAEQNGCTLGKAVSELARKGANGGESVSAEEIELHEIDTGLQDPASGEIPVVGRGPAISLAFGPPFAKVITSEEVRRALEDFP